jgi:hypothetical protein
MKTLLQFAILLLLLNAQLSYAQAPFVPLSFNTDSSDIPSKFCESKTGTRYLFTGYRSDKDSAQFVFMTDNMGNVLAKRYLDINDGDGALTCIHCNTDNTFSLFGWKKSYADSIIRLYYCKIDSNLNIIRKRENIALDKNLKPYNHISISSTVQGQNVYTTATYTFDELDSTTTLPYAHKWNSKWIKQNFEGDTLLTITPPSYAINAGYLQAGVKGSELLMVAGAIRKVDTNLTLLILCPISLGMWVFQFIQMTHCLSQVIFSY